MTRLRAAGCVWAEDEAALLLAEAAARGTEVEPLLRRRVDGEPLEHVLGWAEFAGVRVAVRPGVFVPRHRSEAIVDAAVPLVRAAAARRAPHPPVVVDLCCGTGALGLATVRRAGVAVQLHAADLDPDAVAAARDTLTGPNGVPGAVVHEGDLLDALPAGLRGRIDVLIANVPYVPTAAIATLPPEFRDHEHRMALDGGDDGLDVARRLLADLPDWLAVGGSAIGEASEAQAVLLVEAARASGLDARAVADEERETTVVVTARR
ncbi:MAG: putative protein N(5)-glutamine methyltransferase [Kineosporiaceae bacterium]